MCGWVETKKPKRNRDRQFTVGRYPNAVCTLLCCCVTASVLPGYLLQVSLFGSLTVACASVYVGTSFLAVPADQESTLCRWSLLGWEDQDASARRNRERESCMQPYGKDQIRDMLT